MVHSTATLSHSEPRFETRATGGFLANERTSARLGACRKRAACSFRCGVVLTSYVLRSTLRCFTFSSQFWRKWERVFFCFFFSRSRLCRRSYVVWVAGSVNLEYGFSCLSFKPTNRVWMHGVEKFIQCKQRTETNGTNSS